MDCFRCGREHDDGGLAPESAVFLDENCEPSMPVAAVIQLLNGMACDFLARDREVKAGERTVPAWGPDYRAAVTMHLNADLVAAAVAALETRSRRAAAARMRAIRRLR